MSLLADAMSGLGAALLPVAAALLFEELTFGGLVRLLLAPWPGARKHGAPEAEVVARVRTERAQAAPHKPKTGLWGPRSRRRREMIALKMLLMIAGVLMMAAAVAIPLYGLWMRIQYAMKKKSVRMDCFWSRACRTGTWSDCVARAGGAGAGGVPAAADGGEHGGGAERDGRRAHQPDRRNGAGNAVSGGALCYSAGGERADVRSARSHVHRRHCGCAASRASKNAMTVQSREGLNIGLAVTVRYRLDPNKLASVQAHLPQPADKELVPPVVASAWRELAPSYTVREIFSSKREEVRSAAAGIITTQAGARTASWWKR